MNEKALKLLQQGKAILICPEQLGGLTTPRLPHEIVGGTGKDVLEGKVKILSNEGEDSTEKFVKGAYEALKIAKSVKATKAILKAKSPSCGCGEIYDGSFSSKKIEGNGVTAELFLKNGIKIYTEDEIEDR